MHSASLAEAAQSSAHTTSLSHQSWLPTFHCFVLLLAVRLMCLEVGFQVWLFHPKLTGETMLNVQGCRHLINNVHTHRWRPDIGLRQDLRKETSPEV